MADIELVIKIPERDYDLACNYPDALIATYAHCIKNGTQLPKGHGRIADMDAAIKCIEEIEGADAMRAIGLIEWACGKRTIVEADKAEMEDERWPTD